MKRRRVRFAVRLIINLEFAGAGGLIIAMSMRHADWPTNGRIAGVIIGTTVILLALIGIDFFDARMPPS